MLFQTESSPTAKRSNNGELNKGFIPDDKNCSLTSLYLSLHHFYASFLLFLYITPYHFVLFQTESSPTAKRSNNGELNKGFVPDDKNGSLPSVNLSLHHFCVIYD